MSKLDAVIIGIMFSLFLSFQATAKTVITPDGTIIVCTTDKNGITVCI
jgi:hypothetical protein